MNPDPIIRSNPSRILVVDDEENTRLALCLLLQGKGYCVSTASHGLEALENLRQQTADFVLTDLHMPQMSGLDLLRSVKRDFPGVRVIMMTAIGGVQAQMEARLHGACDFLLKPVRSEELHAVLERWMIADANGGRA